MARRHFRRPSILLADRGLSHGRQCGCKRFLNLCHLTQDARMPPAILFTMPRITAKTKPECRPRLHYGLARIPLNPAQESPHEAALHLPWSKSLEILMPFQPARSTGNQVPGQPTGKCRRKFGAACTKSRQLVALILELDLEEFCSRGCSRSSIELR